MDNKTKKWLDLEKVKAMNKVEEDFLNGSLKMIRKKKKSQLNKTIDFMLNYNNMYITPINEIDNSND